MWAARVGAVVLLMAAVTAVRLVANQPSLAISVYALIPVVLGAFWFELRGALLIATAATLLYVGDELLAPSPELTGAAMWIAAANRAAVYFGVAVLVALLLRRERRWLTRLTEQQHELDELESLRAALTPPDLPPRPQLEMASSFTPADGLVAGDFFLVTEGPLGSTTIVVGDVLGHGVEAARCAAHTRAALATFATFSSDPVQLLQFANAALIERAGDRAQFVTATRVNIGAPPEMALSWACAGQDAPWSLDTGAPLSGGRAGVPLGMLPTVPTVLAVEAGHAQLPPGWGLIIFTDGLPEGRPARREPSNPLELFGEDRAREVIQSQWGASPEHVVTTLLAALTDHAGGPLADDVCIIACRAAPAPVPTSAAGPEQSEQPTLGVTRARAAVGDHGTVGTLGRWPQTDICSAPASPTPSGPTPLTGCSRPVTPAASRSTSSTNASRWSTPPSRPTGSTHRWPIFRDPSPPPPRTCSSSMRVRPG